MKVFKEIKVTPPNNPFYFYIGFNYDHGRGTYAVNAVWRGKYMYGTYHPTNSIFSINNSYPFSLTMLEKPNYSEQYSLSSILYDFFSDNKDLVFLKGEHFHRLTPYCTADITIQLFQDLSTIHGIFIEVKTEVGQHEDYMSFILHMPKLFANKNIHPNSSFPSIEEIPTQ